MNAALGNRRREAVFLCYHSIAARGAPYLALPADLFERQLALLRRRGYRSGRVEDLVRLNAGERLPGPTVFLTFDDGFRDNFETAWPLLRSYGFSALIFILPGHLASGSGFEWPEVAEDRSRYPDLMRSMTWREIDEMLGQGAEVGSHTITHPHLCDLDDETLAGELAESRVAIEQRIGTCETLAYPFGEWDERVARAARAAGYSFAFSLPQGPQARCGALCIPRLNVDRRDRPARLRFKLSPTGRRFLFSPTAERVRGLRPGSAREASSRGAAG